MGAIGVSCVCEYVFSDDCEKVGTAVDGGGGRGGGTGMECGG